MRRTGKLIDRSPRRLRLAPALDRRCLCTAKRPLEKARVDALGAMGASARPLNWPLDYLRRVGDRPPRPDRLYVDQIRFESYDGRAVLIEVGPIPADGSD